MAIPNRITTAVVLDEEDVQLLRRVAHVRALLGEVENVSVSNVIRELVEANRVSFEAEVAQIKIVAKAAPKTEAQPKAAKAEKPKTAKPAAKKTTPKKEGEKVAETTAPTEQKPTED